MMTAAYSCHVLTSVCKSDALEHTNFDKFCVGSKQLSRRLKEIVRSALLCLLPF